MLQIHGVIKLLPDQLIIKMNNMFQEYWMDSPRFRQLCICLAFPKVVFVLIMYGTLSHMLGHVTSSANGQLYTIKINKVLFIRLLKRGRLYLKGIVNM